jgi:integrase
MMISTDDELRLLRAIEHANETRRYKKREPAPLYEVLMIMLDCGMRPSEVVGMRREHVHSSEPVYLNPKGKTRYARRRVPLSERALAILRPRMQSDTREGWVFPSVSAKSGHIELGALQRKFRAMTRALNIPDQLKLYCARHTFATVAMSETKDPALVRETMGHSDLKTTMGLHASRRSSDQSHHRSKERKQTDPMMVETGSRASDLIPEQPHNSHSNSHSGFSRMEAGAVTY